jgi:hypothetical protein
MRVTANLLPMPGVEPLMGRVFTADEDQPGAHPVILLSHGLWKRQSTSEPGDEIYLPYLQRPRQFDQLTFVVLTRTSSESCERRIAI